MRRKYILISAALFVCLIAGCHSGGGRDLSSPGKAFLGHWKQTVPGFGQIYVSPDRIVYAMDGQKKPIDVAVPYTISGENGKAFSVDIKLESASGAATVTFSKDRNTMTMLPAWMPERLQYVYVDGKQKP